MENETLQEEIVYDTSKEQCRSMIKGVCSGCGGSLEPMETVTNSGKPTYWAACPRCELFDWGCDPHVYAIAKSMVVNENYRHYSNSVLKRPDADSEDWYREYYLHSQIRGTTSIVRSVLKINNQISKVNLPAVSPALNTMLHDPNVKAEEATQESAAAQESAAQDNATGATDAEEGTTEG